MNVQMYSIQDQSKTPSIETGVKRLAETPELAIAFFVQDHPEWKGREADLIAVEVKEEGRTEEEEPVILSRASTPTEKPTRKQRTDKGKEHEKKVGYFLFDGTTLTEPLSKAETEQLLVIASPEKRVQLRLIQGREIVFSLKVEGL